MKQRDAYTKNHASWEDDAKSEDLDGNVDP